jgi:hypothetical protein
LTNERLDMEKSFVTVKFAGATITCKPEDVASIMSALNGNAPAKDGKKVFEKSSVIHKAIRNIKAETPEELVTSALANRDGLHTVFSGLNDELRTRFGADPIEVTESMINDGLIDGRPAKRGFWITRK